MRQFMCLLLLVTAMPTEARPLPPGATIVQLFEWPWASIASECPRLAATGIRYVHVSPPNEHVPLPGSPWYDRYQPVSYRIGNRGGDETSFRNMLTACREAGVNVLVDAVINHMAIIPPEGVQRFGNLGSNYWRYSFPGLYSWWDFHRCDRNPPDSHIYNYNDRYEVQHCNLAGLADLATGTDYVRDTLAAYMRRLVDMGVAGFRIDAAKHIPAGDIGAIIARMERPDTIIFQEVIGSPSEPIKAQEYLANGSVSDFSFAAAVGWRFRDANFHGIFDQLNNLDLASRDAVVFIDNHDTQRGHGAGWSALSYKNGHRYAAANAFMLAWPFGTPILMSSFRFNSDQDGPPLYPDGMTLHVAGDCDRNQQSPWVCEHRWLQISGMAKWRETVGDAPVVNLVVHQTEMAFGRGDRGFFAVNLGSQSIQRQYQTQLPRGSYCNALAARPPTGACPDDAIIRVYEGGLADVTVPPNAAVATDVRHRFNRHYP
jgi:alpha-amylase